MTSWVMIALGGAAGSVLRYAVQIGVHRAAGGTFPLGTLLVNVAGCLAIGAVAAAAGPLAMREEHRLAIMTGLLGGFTTFSAFGLETLQLAASGEARLAATNVVLSVGLGLAAVWGGYRGAEQLL